MFLKTTQHKTAICRKGAIFHRIGHNHAQAVLEFVTASIVFIMLAFGLVQIFRWAPKMLYEKTNLHDECMNRDEGGDFSVNCFGNISAIPIEAALP